VAGGKPSRRPFCPTVLFARALRPARAPFGPQAGPSAARGTPLSSGGPTVGFSGSGGAGKTPSPENYSAGSRRIPASGEAAVRLQTVLGSVSFPYCAK